METSSVRCGRRRGSVHPWLVVDPRVDSTDPVLPHPGDLRQGVDNLEPIEPVTQVSAEDLRRWERVAAFTAIASPSGVHEPVHHVWRKDGRIVATMPMTRIRGGRHRGYRTYSWKAEFGPDPGGLWSVEVRTSDDRLVGRIWLRVIV